MPTFQITVPDGRTFEVTGPNKQTAQMQFMQVWNEKGQRGLKLRDPGQYDPDSKEFKARFGPTAGNTGMQNFRAGMGSRFVGRARSLGNMLGFVPDAAIKDAKKLDQPLMDTTGGYLGGMGADVALSALGGTSLAGGAAAGLALGATDPYTSDGTERAQEALKGGAWGLGGAALGKWGAAQLARRTAQSTLRAKQAAPLLETMDKAHEMGLVHSPSASNPTFLNRLFEGIAGKDAIKQESAFINAPRMQDGIRRYLGLAPDAPLTLETTAAARASRANAYAEVTDLVNKVGGVGGNQRFVDTLNDIQSRLGGAHRFGAGVLPEHTAIRDLIHQLKTKTPFDGNEAMQLVKDLRLEAGKSFANRSKTLGKAQREVADAIEQAIEDNISRYGGNLGGGSIGKQYARQVLRDWRNARVADAKTYLIDKVINLGSGNIEGSKIARELARGAPLTGEARDIAKFASAFQGSAKSPTGAPGVNALTTMFAAESILLGHPEGGVLTPLRHGVAKMMLSPTYQKLMTDPRGAKILGSRVGGYLKPKTRIPKIKVGLGRTLSPYAINRMQFQGEKENE